MRQTRSRPDKKFVPVPGQLCSRKLCCPRPWCGNVHNKQEHMFGLYLISIHPKSGCHHAMLRRFLRKPHHARPTGHRERCCDLLVCNSARHAARLRKTLPWGLTSSLRRPRPSGSPLVAAGRPASQSCQTENFIYQMTPCRGDLVPPSDLPKQAQTASALARLLASE